MEQINPPFDGSAACPACQESVRNVSALVHNFLNRCDKMGVREGKAFVKLNDLRRTNIPEDHELKVPHPAAIELMAVARELRIAVADMEDHGLEIRWTPEIRAAVDALVPRAMAASDAFRPLVDAHFEDNRHCSSSYSNILRESRGSHFAGFVNPGYEAASYNYTVEEVSEGGDLEHKVCGIRLKIHDHFKAKMSKDPTFYRQVWCPKCRVNASIEQFDVDFIS